MSAVDTHPTNTEGSTPLRSWVAAHPVVSYLILAYGLSWAYWIPFAMGSWIVESGKGWPSAMPGLAGPGLAAIVVTAVIGGRTRLSELWKRMTKWRVGWWWLGVLGILLAGALGLAFAGGVADASQLTLYNGISASLGPLTTILIVLVINGLGEEMGWRGFMVEHLLPRHGLTVTSLLVALAWAPWHTPVFFLIGSFMNYGTAQLIGWAIGLTAGSICLTWLYRGSGHSILLVAAWHTAFNFVSGTPASQGLVAAISSTVVMLAAVAIVVVEWKRGRLSRTP